MHILTPEREEGEDHFTIVPSLTNVLLLVKGTKAQGVAPKTALDLGDQYVSNLKGKKEKRGKKAAIKVQLGNDSDPALPSCIVTPSAQM